MLKKDDFLDEWVDEEVSEYVGGTDGLNMALSQHSYVLLKRTTMRMLLLTMMTMTMTMMMVNQHQTKTNNVVSTYYHRK